jgi:hypothetical protein
MTTTMTMTMRPSPSRFASLLGLVTAVALAGGAVSCSHDSYLVVLLKSRTTTLSGVTKVVVNVKDVAGTPMVTRTFTAKDISIDSQTGQRFSLSFSPDRSGQVVLTLNVTTPSGCRVGTGAATINKGGVAYAAVILDPSTSCGLTAGDGGVTDGKNTFMGCDPAVTDACGPNQTCYVDCANKIGACVPGGAKGPGAACASNSDCMPGTQCFDYGCATPTKVCLKFCDNDVGCSAPTIVGVPATCSDPVVCTEGVTSYKTCGFQCDPRGAGTTGCPSGLTCFLFKNPAGGEDSPACACPSSTRVGGDGATCVSSNNCAPGFLCDQMGGGQFCRKICKMSTPTDCPSTPVKQTCTALQNNTVFGVCI